MLPLACVNVRVTGSNVRPCTVTAFVLHRSVEDCSAGAPIATRSTSIVSVLSICCVFVSFSVFFLPVTPVVSFHSTRVAHSLNYVRCARLCCIRFLQFLDWVHPS